MADAVATIRRLADEKPLRFSTEEVAPPDRFHFAIRMSAELKGEEPQYTEYLVVKDGERVGVLVRSRDGLPYGYLTEGLMVMLDQGELGHLLVYRKGAPSVVLGMTEEGQLDFGVSHVVSLSPLSESRGDLVFAQLVAACGVGLLIS